MKKEEPPSPPAPSPPPQPDWDNAGDWEGTMEEDYNHDNQLEAAVKEEAIEPEKPDVYVAVVAVHACSHGNICTHACCHGNRFVHVYCHGNRCVPVCCHGNSDCPVPRPEAAVSVGGWETVRGALPSTEEVRLLHNVLSQPTQSPPPPLPPSSPTDAQPDHCGLFSAHAGGGW